MDPSGEQGSQTKAFRWIIDLGLSSGLLLAVAAVVAIDRRQAPPPPPTSSLDVVFLLDHGAQMQEMVAAMKANCLVKVDALRQDKLNCRFAVVPFGSGGKDNIPAIPLTADAEDFKRRLGQPAPPEGAAPASCAEALEQALRMDFCNGSVVFFLTTRTPCQRPESLAELGRRMNQRQIKAVIQAEAAEKDVYQPLYRDGGRFFTVSGEDLTGITGDAKKTAATDVVGSLISVAPKKETADPTNILAVTGLYGLRTAKNREEWVSYLGGSTESEAAVNAGLAWLARHQADDGHWSDAGKCEQDGPCQNLSTYGATVAETGLAVLAFQAGGNYYFNDRKYSDHVKRGLDWLVKQQKRDGCLFGPAAKWYEHGIGTFALAEACAVARAEKKEPDPRYLDAATHAIKFMERHQYRGGGWQYQLDQPGCGDTSVTGWQVLALKSAMEAKIEVSPDTIRRVVKFFDACATPATGRTGYMDKTRGSDLNTAVGLIVQEFIVKKPGSQLARNAVRYLGRCQQEKSARNFTIWEPGSPEKSARPATFTHCTTRRWPCFWRVANLGKHGMARFAMRSSSGKKRRGVPAAVGHTHGAARWTPPGPCSRWRFITATRGNRRRRPPRQPKTRRKAVSSKGDTIWTLRANKDPRRRRSAG